MVNLCWILESQKTKTGSLVDPVFCSLDITLTLTLHIPLHVSNLLETLP